MDSKFNKEVGNRIKKLRQKTNLTQAQVAEKAGININYFAVIERGEVTTSPVNLKKISKVLGVSVSDIIG